MEERGGTYFHSIGAARVLGAGSTVINSVPRVTAGLVTSQLEEGPVVLVEVELLFLAAHEEVLTLGHESGQGLGVEPPQLGVGAFLAADAAQKAVELQLGAAGGGLAAHAELRGRGGGGCSAWEAGAPAAAFAARQPRDGDPVAIAFESFLQRLRRGDGVVMAVPGVQGIAKVSLVVDTDVRFRVAKVQLRACGSCLGGTLGPEKAIGGRGCPAHQLFLGQWRGLSRATVGHILGGARREWDRSKELLPADGGRVRRLIGWT